MSILELDLKLCQAMERKELAIKRLKKKHLATLMKMSGLIVILLLHYYNTRQYFINGLLQFCTISVDQSESPRARLTNEIIVP